VYGQGVSHDQNNKHGSQNNLNDEDGNQDSAVSAAFH